MAFTLTIMGKKGAIHNPWIELDGYYKLEMPGEFLAGQSIVFDGEKLKLYNEKGGFVKELPLSQPVPVLIEGEHHIKFDCEFSDEGQLKIRSVFKTISNPEIIFHQGG